MRKKVSGLIADTKPYTYNGGAKIVSKSESLLKKYSTSQIVVDLNHSTHKDYKKRVGVIEKSELVQDGDVTKLVAKQISFYDKDTVNLINNNPKGYGLSAEFIPNDDEMVKKEDGTFEVRDGAIFSVAIVPNPRHRTKDLEMHDSEENMVSELTFYDSEDDTNNLKNNTLEEKMNSIYDKVISIFEAVIKEDSKVDLNDQKEVVNSEQKIEVEDKKVESVENKESTDHTSFKEEVSKAIEELAFHVKNHIDIYKKENEFINQKVSSQELTLKSLFPKKEEVAPTDIVPSIEVKQEKPLETLHDSDEVKKDNLKEIKDKLNKLLGVK